jgi:hypothetical protein
MRVNKTVSAVLATTFAGAVALGGITAAGAFAADEPRQQAAQQAPLPQAQKLQQQARVLGDAGGVLTPVAELMEAVLNAPEGRLSEEAADRHAKAVQEALAPLRNNAQRARATDLTAKAADRLEAQVDQLLHAAEAGNQKRIAKEAEATVQATVNLMTSIVAGGQLPAADMEGLAPQQQRPETEQNGQQGPQLPENQLPPGDAEAEMLPGDAEAELLPGDPKLEQLPG